MFDTAAAGVCRSVSASRCATLALRSNRASGCGVHCGVTSFVEMVALWFVVARDAAVCWRKAADVLRLAEVQLNILDVLCAGEGAAGSLLAMCTKSDTWRASAKGAENELPPTAAASALLPPSNAGEGLANGALLSRVAEYACSRIPLAQHPCNVQKKQPSLSASQPHRTASREANAPQCGARLDVLPHLCPASHYLPSRPHRSVAVARRRVSRRESITLSSLPRRVHA